MRRSALIPPVNFPPSVIHHKSPHQPNQHTSAPGDNGALKLSGGFDIFISWDAAWRDDPPTQRQIRLSGLSPSRQLNAQVISYLHESDIVQRQFHPFRGFLSGKWELFFVSI
jgi:hypothetical protein